MTKNIAVLPGDGIGPEITGQASRILQTVAERFGHSFQLNQLPSFSAVEDDLPEGIAGSDAVLCGTLRNGSFKTKLYTALGLVAEMRQVKVYGSLQHLSPLKNKLLTGVDLVVYRALPVSTSDTGIDYGHDYTQKAAAQLARLGLESARQRRKRLTLVLEAGNEEPNQLAQQVETLLTEFDGITVDRLSHHEATSEILRDPAAFDVLLTDNRLGDILNDEVKAISATPGLMANAAYGEMYALFGPVQLGTDTEGGKDIANPVGSILSAANMLRYFGMRREAEIVEEACAWTISHLFVARDIDPVNYYFTSTIGELICDFIVANAGRDTTQRPADVNASTII